MRCDFCKENFVHSFQCPHCGSLVQAFPSLKIWFKYVGQGWRVNWPLWVWNIVIFGFLLVMLSIIVPLSVTIGLVSMTGALGFSLVIMVVTAVLLMILLKGVVWLSGQKTRQTWFNFLSAIGQGFGFWILAVIILVLAIFAGLKLFYLPMFLVVIFLSLFLWVIQFEKINIWLSIKRSVKLVLVGSWPLVNRLLLLMILGYVLGLVGRMAAVGILSLLLVVTGEIAMQIIFLGFRVLIFFVLALYLIFSVLTLSHLFQTVVAQEGQHTMVAGYRWWQKVLVVLGFAAVIVWQFLLWAAQTQAVS